MGGDGLRRVAVFGGPMLAVGVPGLGDLAAHLAGDAGMVGHVHRLHVPAYVGL